MTDPSSVPIVPGGPTPTLSQMMPAPPRKTSYKGLGWIIAGCTAVVLLGVAAFVASSLRPSSGGGSGSSAAARSDVSTPECGHKSGSRDFTAAMTVTNSTDQPRDYTVTVVFLRGDKTEITTGTGRVNRLQPGKAFRLEAVGRAASEFLISCEIDDVRRA